MHNQLQAKNYWKIIAKKCEHKLLTKRYYTHELNVIGTIADI